MDFALKGVPTLWCSFELKNEVIITTMLKQLSGESLETDAEKFNYWADEFEKLPIYFQRFFGSTETSKILGIIDFSIMVYDVSHIVLDNLQFMLSGQGRGYERFELQDDLISKLRALATDRNVHITVVIHPKKTEDTRDLDISSIFGTAKATQEADNIFIIQNRNQFKILDIKKNRFDGEIGKVALIFDRGSRRYYSINNKDIEEILQGKNIADVVRTKVALSEFDLKSRRVETVRAREQLLEQGAQDRQLLTSETMRKLETEYVIDFARRADASESEEDSSQNDSSIAQPSEESSDDRPGHALQAADARPPCA